MRPLPRNERRRSPRPGDERAPEVAAGEAPRRAARPAVRVTRVWIPPTTPTPPPVSVTRAPSAPIDPRVARAPAKLAPRPVPASEAAGGRRAELVARSRPAARTPTGASAWLGVLFAFAVVLGLVVERSRSGGEPGRPRTAVAAASPATMVLEAAAPTASLAARSREGSAPAESAGGRGAAGANAARAAAAAAPAPPPPPAAPAAPARADARFRRAGYDTVRGGVVYFPETFSSADGAYDVLIHFHGNVKIVVESAEVAHLDAVTAIINLGIGSAHYQEAYWVPGAYESLLAEIQRSVAARGLDGARLRRVALSSWSAGYGALSSVLELGRGPKPDALLVLDGIHCGWLEEDKTALNFRQLGPFVRAAKDAAGGKLLFSITHSQIDPIDYAAAEATASFLVKSVGARRRPSAEAPPYLHLRSMEGAVIKRLEKTMDPTTEATAGGLHVRGFRGNTREHHMAHLFQMGATVLPELVRRWSLATDGDRR